MIKISVVIATYNRASLLRATLEGLKHQQYEPGDEVIVVDNGSTDATVDVIREAGDGFPVPLRSLREAARGRSSALNTGIAVARGTVVAFTDDDVLVSENWVGTIRHIFTDLSIALVGGRVDPNWECPPPPWLRLLQNGQYGSMTSPLALQHYGGPQELGDRTAVGANTAVRRTVFEALGGLHPDLGRQSGRSLMGVEDHEFCRRLQRAGCRCVYRPEVHVRHWVPAKRMRLSYYLRWFFWSGYASGLLGSDNPIGSDGLPRPVPGYFLRRVLITSALALTHALRRHVVEAAENAVEAAFALGYVVQRLRAGLAHWVHFGWQRHRLLLSPRRSRRTTCSVHVGLSSSGRFDLSSRK